jgi:hypothetical protein
MDFLKAIAILLAPVFGTAGCCSLTHTKDFPYGCGSRSVAIIVESSLSASIRTGLSQFEADLCTGGFNTIEHTIADTTPSGIRAYLQGLYEEPGRNLVGALLIGDIPHAYQQVTFHSANPHIPATNEETISFQYYSDLDGTFAASPEYVSPGGHLFSYDIHSGDVDWEIWVGVLPRYKDDLALTVDALNRYFAKNHDFRTRQLIRPNLFLQINELIQAATIEDHNILLEEMRTGIYAWTPYSSEADALLYFNSPPGGLSTDQGYADMQAGVADFSVTDSHGFWGASGELTIESVETDPVRTLFFWSNGCSVGDLDHADNFLTSVLYSPTSEVLIAKGTTNNSGGMGNNSNGFFGHNIATALDARATYGDAMIGHVNVPLIPPWSDNREFHFATAVILGDPTLKRSSDWWEQASYPFDCTSRPRCTVCIEYDDGFTWLVRDSISGWERTGDVQTAIGLTGRYEHVIGTDLVRISHH